MSPGSVSESAVRRLLAGKRALLLSFDGPVCALSSALSSLHAADRLRTLVAAARHPVPGDLHTADDPLAILRYATTLGDSRLVFNAEYESSVLEWDAMSNAVPTPGAHESMKAARAAGMQVGIVSDRSGWAIEHYLELHGLTQVVARPVGRYTSQPQRWKPDTFQLLFGVLQAGADVESALFVGSTALDVETALAAQVLFIGIAGLRASADELRTAGAKHVLGPDGMLLLATLLGGSALGGQEH